MAITTITVPADIVPAYNPIVITCESDNVAEDNFKFIFQVVIDGETKTIRLSPRPDAYGLIDVHRVVENYVTSNFSVGDGTNAIDCTDSYIEVMVNIGEAYGTPSADYLNLSSISFQITNAALKHTIASFGSGPAFIDTDLRTDYVMSELVTGTNRPFLTGSPRELCIDNDQNYYLYALLNPSNNPKKLKCIWYDSAGMALGNNTKTLTLGGDGISRYGVGTKNIKLWNAANLIGASYYTVQLVNNSGTAISELFRFDIGCDCSKYEEHFRLHWLNELGGYDAFNFKHAYRRDFNIAKSTFMKKLGEVSSIGDFTFGTSQRGKTQFNAITTESIKINSDWITEEESEWLLSLVKSSVVNWEIDATTYAPVTIKDTNYKSKTYAADGKLFNLEITLEISNDIISQRL